MPKREPARHRPDVESLLHDGSCYRYLCAAGCGALLVQCPCDAAEKPVIYNPLQESGVCASCEPGLAAHLASVFAGKTDA